jgi:hypothetical protein
MKIDGIDGIDSARDRVAAGGFASWRTIDSQDRP